MRPVRLDPTGPRGPTRSAARRGHWRRTAVGWYVAAAVPRCPQQRVLEASVHTGPQGAVTGWASLHWQGAAYVDGHEHGTEMPVAVLLGHLGNPRPHPGCVVSRERMGPRDVIVVDGVRCTTPVRAVFDEVRRSPGWRAAVVVADMAVAAGLVTPRQLLDDLPGRTTMTRVSRARTAYRYLRSGHRSPQEALLGLCWEVDAGLPRPLYNRPVFGRDGGLLGIPDLFDREAGLVVEYDGADHRRADRRREDGVRAERFRNHGIEVLTVVAGELDVGGVVAERLLAGRRRVRLRSEDDRAWTLVEPDWWSAYAGPRHLLAG